MLHIAIPMATWAAVTSAMDGFFWLISQASIFNIKARIKRAEAVAFWRQRLKEEVLARNILCAVMPVIMAIIVGICTLRA